MRIGMAGAGLSCAVIARELAERGHDVEIFEERSHLGGNCHTVRDPATGILLHVYGPHIFHTDDEEVWNYVNRYMSFKPFVNRVKALTGGRVFSLPINLLTINQFFNKTLSPSQAQEFLQSQANTKIEDARNFEEQALKLIGRGLYEAFFKEYTKKQWGLEPRELPASILKRLPVRFNYDDNYFSHRFQGMPAEGYTAMVENILSHRAISINLEKKFSRNAVDQFDHVFYSGPIDAYYCHKFGRLQYRTLDFERLETHGDFQGCAVMNYCDSSTPYTRITEHKHFAPWESHDRTVCYREYSRRCEPEDIPYYPVHLVQDNPVLQRYEECARKEQHISFVGRLGTYRYMDMDVTIRQAMDAVCCQFGAEK